MSIDYGDDKNIYSKITVNYSDSLNKKHEKTYVIDFSEFYELNQLGKPPLYEIAQSLKKLRNLLEKCKQITVNSLFLSGRTALILGRSASQ